MLVTPPVSTGTIFAVIGHEFTAKDPPKISSGGFAHIAVLPGSKKAAVGHKSPRKRRVMLRGDIPVIRHLNIKTPILAVADHGKQQPTLAFVRNRKAELWRIGNRYAVELQLQMLSRPHSRGMIQSDLAGLDQY